ncbi:hypothetical protein F4802DRAFT_617633 [Xylaria palmicola]|nr:hypothetical protein F4802DRAFT_617633 [Xylaria palmicola]
MAVLSKLPGVEVTIEVNGQTATEYNDPHPPDEGPEANLEVPLISKYIECIDNTEFSIKLAIDDKVYAWDDVKHNLLIAPNIDGLRVRGRFVNAGAGGITMAGAENPSEGSQVWHCKKFKFSAISTIDTSDVARLQKDMETTKDIGVIRVTLERHLLGIRAPPTIILSEKKALAVSEKALKGKAISHAVSLGRTEAMKPVNIFESTRVKEDNGPIAVFSFKYRSKESLKQELIIPRTPSPDPVDNMPIAELQRLARERLGQLNWAREAKSGHGSAVKREVDDIVDVDAEGSEARPAKRPAITIDLTDD